MSYTFPILGQAIPWAKDFFNLQPSIFDLAGLDISQGAEVWLEVHSLLGKTKQSWERVIFSPNSGDSAIYRITGTVWLVTIRLEN